MNYSFVNAAAVATNMPPRRHKQDDMLACFEKKCSIVPPPQQNDRLACFKKKSSIMPPTHHTQDNKLACFKKTSNSETATATTKTAKREHRRTLPIGFVIDQAALCLLSNPKKTKHRRSSSIFDNTSERLIVDLLLHDIRGMKMNRSHTSHSPLQF
jgi:hypothetical protein